MTTDQQTGSAVAWQWRRGGFAVALLVAASAGLLAGVLYEPESSQNPASGGFASQLAIASEDTALVEALAQAQWQLDRRAGRILRGAVPAVAQVPFRRYSMHLAASADPPIEDVVAGEFEAAVVTRYQLHGGDVTVGHAEAATFTRGRGGWKISQLSTDAHELWAHETVDVAAAGRSLVIGSIARSVQLPAFADGVEAARSQVADFWSTAWPGRVVVVLPGHAQTMKPLIGDRSAARLPAVTTLSRGTPSPVIRVTINPRVFLRLPALGQEIVLRHEITHVAQDALPAGRAPLWLSEGLAEYVGYRGTGIADSIVARELLDWVRSTGVPRSLPGDRAFAFDLGASERTFVYEQGWAACQMVADRFGEDRLVPFYTAVLRADGSTDQRINKAAKQVLGIDKDAFVELWQNWLLGAA